MSKIVCDVCGSTYSETEAQCPICGTAKSEAAKPAVETAGEEQSSKGGKFSKTNTRKTGADASVKKPGNEKNNAGGEGAPSNLAMIIIVTVLLLAIVAVCVFIAVRLIGNPDNPDPSGSSSSSSPTTLQIPCIGIELLNEADKTLTFSALTESAQLTVKALPENTTETVVCTYTSSDPTVVLVDQSGLVTPVANGTATITIAYGSYSIAVDVTCDIPAPITELKLVKNDITLRPASKTYQLYDGELDPADIVWTSSDETIAYVENGLVTAVANGKVTITATYGELTATCTVYVRDMNEDSSFALGCTTSTFEHLSLKDDVTLVEGDKLKIYLVNKETGELVNGLTWEPSNDFKGGCASFEYIDGGIEVTALKTTDNVAGYHVFIRTTYEGVEYKFIIRIKVAETQD